MSTAITLLGIAWVLWALTCWLSPSLLAARRTYLKNVDLNLPPRISGILTLNGIEVLVVRDLKHGYAVSVWALWKRAILVNEFFASFALPEAKQFIICHEAAHHLMGHVTLKLFACMFFLDHLPAVKRWFYLTESQANRYAEQFSGHHPSVVWGPVVLSQIDDARARSMSGVTAMHRGTVNEEKT